MNKPNGTCTSCGRIVRHQAAARDAGLVAAGARPHAATGRAAGGAGYRAPALPDTGTRCRQAVTRIYDVIALRPVLRRMAGFIAVVGLCAGTIANAQSEELTRRDLGLQLATRAEADATASRVAAAKPSGAMTVAKAPRILQVLFSRSSAEQDDFRLLAPSPLIVVTARFDQAVTVDTAYGVPQIDLEMGTPPLRQGGYVGSYAGGSGSDELRFHYAAPHYARSDWYQNIGHVEINANAIRLRGSTIRGIDHLAAASLAHAPVAATVNNAGARSKSALVRTPLPALERSHAPHGGGSDAGLVVDAAAQAAAVPPPSAIRLRSEVLIVGHQLRHWRTFGNGAYKAVDPIPGASGPVPVDASGNGLSPDDADGLVEPVNVRRAAATVQTPRAPYLHLWVRGQTKIILQWSRASSSDIEYLIEGSADGVSNWTNLLGDGNYQAVAPSTTDNAYTHEGLQPATTRYYRVTARNGNGFGPPSDPKSATTKAMVAVPECSAALWSARVTVEEFGLYDDFGYRVGNEHGAISVDRFTIGAATYTVKEVWFSRSLWLFGKHGRELSHAAYHFTLDRVFPQLDREDLILYVGNVRLPLAGAGYTTQPAGQAYRWGGSDEIGDLYDGTFNYVEDDYVPVCLVGSGPRPTLTLKLDPASISENSGVSTVTATASVASPEPYTVTVAAAANASAVAADFTLSANRVLSFAANATVSTGTVTITARNNNLDAAHKTVRVAGSVPDGTRATAPDDVTLTITDDDAAPTLSLAVDQEAIAEDGGVAVVTVSTGGTAFSTRQEVVLGFAGSAELDTDYAVSAQTLTLQAGALLATATITAHNDTVDEDDELIEITASHDGRTAGALQTVKITDDDTASISLLLDPDTLAENAGSTTVTVRTDMAFATEQTISLAFAGSAQRETDYSVPGDTLTLPATETEISTTVTVTDDSVIEGDETIQITASHGSDQVQKSITITDDDAAALTLTLSHDTIAEAGGSATVTVSIGSATFADGQTITLKFDGSATRGTDYLASVDTLALTATQTEASATVTASDDSIDEGDESIRITAVLGSDEVQKSITITDDDTASIELTVNPTSIAEAGGSATVTVSTAGGTTFGTEQTISLSFAGGATRDDDYTVGTDSLVLAANSSSVTTTVTAVSDVLDEDDETIEITAAHGGSSVQQTITIRDDDALSGSAQPMLLTVEPARAREDAGSMVFEARVATPSGRTELAINYEAFAAANDTATPAADFMAVAPATLTLTLARNGDQLAGSFSIPVLDDELNEDDETFSVRVWVEGLTGYDDTAAGTIEDDDAEPGITIADARAVENGGEILFPVRLTRASGRAVTVRYATEDGTARAGPDYHRVAAGILTVAAGRSGATIRVRLRDDDTKEGDETFSVRLIDPPEHATLSGDDVATGTIVDDDGTVTQLWLARFARTTATHVMDAVGDRVTGPPAPQPEMILSGFPVRPGTAAARQDLSDAPVRTLAPHELLAGSSFVLSAGEDGGQPAASASAGAGAGHWTFWGHGSVTRLAAKDAAGSTDEMSLNGTIASGTLGVDYDWGPVVAGLALATTAGGADIAVATEPSREASAWMVSAHPYARVTVAGLVDIWGLLGFGMGAMALTEDQQIEAGTAMLMGALGARGTLVAPDTLAGFGLAVKTDGFVTRIYAEHDTALPNTHADAVLVRVMAEGSYRAQLADGSVLTPVVEAGVRYDRGHAETGFGGELGGGVRYVQPALGLTVSAHGRFLLAHQDRGFQGWGLGGSMQLRPDASGRGPVAAMHTSVGMTATGASGLWADGIGPRVAAFDAGAAAGVFDAELGYGVSILDNAALLTPYAGVTLVDRTANTYRIGGRLDLGPSFSLSLEGERSDSAASPPEHGVALRGALRW